MNSMETAEEKIGIKKRDGVIQTRYKMDSVPLSHFYSIIAEKRPAYVEVPMKYLKSHGLDGHEGKESLGFEIGRRTKGSKDIYGTHVLLTAGDMIVMAPVSLGPPLNSPKMIKNQKSYRI